jgi:hypothetical protein
MVRGSVRLLVVTGLEFGLLSVVVLARALASLLSLVDLVGGFLLPH